MVLVMHGDGLADFQRRTVSVDGAARAVYVAGDGPAVIVMAEMPGISPHVARFARWVRAAGFTVYMPSLFGRDGAYPEAEAGLAVLKRACVSAEFGALAASESSPITRWLRGLARIAHDECGGPGVGTIGMCFTGNFALSMMLEPSVLAPVLCQPSLPLDDPGGLQSAPHELTAVRQRLESEDLTVRAYRFEGDRYCTAQRFAAYAAALGPRFEATVLPDSAANPTPPPFFTQVIRCPHSVVTAHLIDEAGQPTVAARDEILGFFTTRLRGGHMTSELPAGPASQPEGRRKHGLRITGRSSSHFTRAARMVAHELSVPVEFDVLSDIMSLDAADYSGNPALKIPTLHIGDTLLFGTDNICRRLAELAGRADDPRVVLSHLVTSDLVRSAQELVWHAMAAQVQLVLGVRVAGLPAENTFFAKARLGMLGSLTWIEERLDRVLAALPAPRDFSILEVTLFCLLEHISFRPTLPLDAFPNLRDFVAKFAARESAQRTPFHLDSAPIQEST